MCTDTDHLCRAGTAQKSLALQTLETRMSVPSTPTCWNSLSTVLELCGVTVGFSEFGLKVPPCSFFFPWCFETVPFSNTVAKCSSPWRLLCALHVWNGWILLLFGDLHISWSMTFVLLTQILFLSCCLLRSHFFHIYSTIL